MDSAGSLRRESLSACYCCSVSVNRGVHQRPARGHEGTKPVSALVLLRFNLLEFEIEGLYLSESLDLLPAVFFRLGAGILHSMEKATQFVPID